MRRQRHLLPIGSVSSGTMREEDLIPSFLWEADHLRLSREELNEVRAIAHRVERANDDDNDNDDEPYFESESAAEDLEKLFEILNSHTPAFCYFGSHPGDGADYGCWITEELFVSGSYWDEPIFKSDKLPSEAGASERHHFEESGSEYWLFVNDHGNATLYGKDPKRWRFREIWSVV